MSRYLPADHKEHDSYTKLYNFLLTPIQFFNRLLCVIRLLPKQSSQKTGFSFVGKSGKADAFSFVQDEMEARKWIYE